MGRKSREKRERAEVREPSEPSAELGFASPPAAIDETLGTPQPPAKQRQPRSRKAGPVGARVARVAADDQTWEAFKQLCGSTPASVRLGQMVAAEVAFSRRPSSEPAAVAAVEEIRAQLDALEAIMRASSHR
jgi:hypothetical protein